ncbi:MAG: hypothetical protein EON52_04555 [Actinomycetales bacterium]|nr:MAG: hypothetical protein EON52_04555 [Actinomycetales bacterium]
MRLVAAVALVLALVGCTGDGSDDQGRPQKVDRSRLLALADLPKGFDVAPFEVAAPAGDTSEACMAVADVAVPSSDAPGLKVSFAQGTSGPFVTEALRSAEDPAEILDDLDEALDDCTSIDLDEGAAQQVYTVERVDVKDHGEEAIAMKLSATLRGTPFTSTTVVVREGSWVTAVSLAGSEDRTMEGSTFDDVIDKAVERLAGTAA